MRTMRRCLGLQEHDQGLHQLFLQGADCHLLRLAKGQLWDGRAMELGQAHLRGLYFRM